MHKFTSRSTQSAKQVGFLSFWETFISKFRLNSFATTSRSYATSLFCSIFWDCATYLGQLVMEKTKGGYYAVARGHSVGIFQTWAECQENVDGYSNARYKKFQTEKEASDFIKENRGPSLVSIKKIKNDGSKKIAKLVSTSTPTTKIAGFDMDEAGHVVVYTDGACSANGKNGAKAGIGVWFGDCHRLNVSEPVRGRQTNNTAEIQAAEVAISQAKQAGIVKLCVKTDSQFVINCITKWVDKWSKNGWKLSDGQPVKNKEDLERLIAVMKGIEIKWSYVAGHKGHRGNEEADRLAVLGAKKQ